MVTQIAEENLISCPWDENQPHIFKQSKYSIKLFPEYLEAEFRTV